MATYPLRQLYFYLTEGCNCACRHCWLGPKLDTDADRYPTLSVEAFQTAITEAKPLGLTGVKLTGGEPLLHPAIERLIGIVQDQELQLTIETNGLLCTPALAAAIAQTRNPFVSVSLDGAEAETHEWVRGVQGSFAAACRAVQHLAQAGLRPQVIFSVMRRNADQVDAIIALAASLGARSVKFNMIQPTARGELLHAQDEALSVAELIALGRRVETELARQTDLRLFFDYPQAFRSLSRLASPDGCGVCGIKGILGVLASGRYALCGIGETVAELVLGQVGSQSLAALWSDHPVLEALRQGLPDQLSGICGECVMRGRCLGSCVAQNYYRSQNLFAPFWFCEQAAAEGLFPASRRR